MGIFLKRSFQGCANEPLGKPLGQTHGHMLAHTFVKQTLVPKPETLTQGWHVVSVPSLGQESFATGIIPPEDDRHQHEDAAPQATPPSLHITVAGTHR